MGILSPIKMTKDATMKRLINLSDYNAFGEKNKNQAISVVSGMERSGFPDTKSAKLNPEFREIRSAPFPKQRNPLILLTPPKEL